MVLHVDLWKALGILLVVWSCQVMLCQFKVQVEPLADVGQSSLAVRHAVLTMTFVHFFHFGHVQQVDFGFISVIIVLSLVLDIDQVGRALHDHGAVLGIRDLGRLLQLVDAALLVCIVVARPQSPVLVHLDSCAFVQVGQILSVLGILHLVVSLIVFALLSLPGPSLLLSLFSPD